MKLRDAMRSWEPKVGDKVVIIERALVNVRGCSVTTVDRITKTLLITANGRRYKLRNIRGGMLSEHIGGEWSTNTHHVYPANHPDLPREMTYVKQARAIAKAEDAAAVLRGDLKRNMTAAAMAERVARAAAELTAASAELLEAAEALRGEA